MQSVSAIAAVQPLGYVEVTTGFERPQTFTDLTNDFDGRQIVAIDLSGGAVNMNDGFIILTIPDLWCPLHEIVASGQHEVGLG